MCYSTISLTGCHKLEVFLHLYLQFFCLAAQLRCKYFRLWKQTAAWNSSCGFDFGLIVIGMWFCIGLPDFIRIGLSASDDIVAILQDGCHSVANLLPVWWRLTAKKDKSYLYTKFRQDISIHGWETFGFWKQTADILKFLHPVSIVTFTSS